MRTLLLLFATPIILVSCTKKAAPTASLSPCLDTSIATWSKDTPCDDAYVAEYIFQGKTVFVLHHGTCGADMTDAVLDKNCQLLGNLGGITGNMKINGEPFSNAHSQKIVWKAQR